MLFRSVTSSVTLYYGASALTQITTPTRTGYTFRGYYTEANGGGQQIYTANGTSALTSDDTTYVDRNGKWVNANNFTLYAYWTANTYSITFNAEGGSNGGTASYIYDANVARQSTYLPKRTGHIFNGYYTAKNGGVQVFDDSMDYQKGVGAGSTVTSQSTGTLSQFYQNTTLYAQWTPVRYTIHYYSWDPDKQDDVYVGQEEDVVYGSMTFLNDTDLAIEKNHNTFNGWNTISEQDWSMYQANRTYSGGLTETDGAIVPLYAVWQPLGQISVSFKPEGGKGIPADGIAY